MNALIEFEKCKNIYHELNNFINNIKICDNEIVNGILIKYKNKKWITGTIMNIDGNFTKDEMNIEMNIEIIIENNYYCYNIKCIKSLLDENISQNTYEDINNETLFFDQHLNLFFIKFEEEIDDNLYYNLDDNDIKDLLNINYNTCPNIYFKYLTAKNNNLEIIRIDGIIIDTYYWNNSFIWLPPIPYLKCKVENTKPQTGSAVLNNDGKLVGIVSYYDDNVIITPLVSIIRSLNYFSGHKLKIINIDTINTKIICNDIIENGIIINNNYNKNLYDHYKKLVKKNTDNDSLINLMKIYKKYGLLKKGSIIRSINNKKINQDGNIQMDNISIPIKSYIWYLINEEYINIELYKTIKKNSLINAFEINLNKINSNFILFKLENKNITTNIDEINYIKYNNKYLFELNETFIDIFQNLILNNSYINNYLINNKYNIRNKKIILAINLIENNIILKIVHKFSSIIDIKNNLNRKAQKRYIKKLLP
jgi:hypothetical protein